MAELRAAWEAWRTRPFPSTAHDIDAPAPELLDTEVAGIVTTILSGSGTVSVSQARLLSLVAHDLDRLRPQLDDKAATYFDELRAVVTLAIAMPVR